MNFDGCYTALITPFNEDLSIDYHSLEELVEEQISQGISGIVALGTTAESPTVNNQEHINIIDFICQKVAGRVKVIAGTGANNTLEAIELTKKVAHCGVDATLQVTPYYNKPSQEGLYQHFQEISKVSDLPIILYNVPGRSSIALSIELVQRLAENPKIVAIKEAGGCVQRVCQIKKLTDLVVMGGDDALILPMMSVGATGLISVLSNLLPAKMTQLVNSYLNGNIKDAQELFFYYYDLMVNMFIESNPVPIKTCLAMQGKIHEVFRLPLCSMSPENKNSLHNLYLQYSL